MTIESLARVHGARPFQPFAFHLVDGRTLSIPHPEFLAFNPKGRTAVVMDERDGVEIVDLLLVVSLTFEERSARAEGGNGSSTNA